MISEPVDAPTSARVEDLVRAMTLDEKASLTAGADLWHTVPIERLGVPSFRLTDGPSGARGAAFDDGTSAVAPCGSALGATWNPELVEQVGQMIGHQARTKSCRVLLAPTVNLHRSPLGGRTFEAYSEDPLLAGRLAAAFVRGAQSQGVACTVKHLAGNEAEFQRFTIDSVVDERALRELYLAPFEHAVRDGQALGVMTAYNRLNGSWCSEDPALLTRVLRDEWGFRGFVVSDWFALTDTVRSPTAGLDLEMPGPARQLGAHVADAVRGGLLDEAVLDLQVRRLLRVFDELGALDDPLEPGPEVSVDLGEHRVLARRAAAESVVLLKNDGVLPFDVAGLRSIAVIGPNARRLQIVGGGSASLAPHHQTTFLDALRDVDDAVDVCFEPGCTIDRSIPPIDVSLDYVVLDGATEHRRSAPSTQLLFFGPPVPEVAERPWRVVGHATVVPDRDGCHDVAFIHTGRARLLIDGDPVVHGAAERPLPGPALFGLAREQVATTRDLRAGAPVELTIEIHGDGESFVSGATVGIRPRPPDDLLERAVAAAAAADAAIVVVGTTPEWESESFARSTLGLPGAQDELVRRVCEANRRTAVVVNAGSPVAMPWVHEAPAVLAASFGGQEMAHALVDVLTGDADPGGRLATTFPRCIEHTAAFGNFPGDDGEVRYGESLLMGYRWHDARKLDPLYAFGHGLSYTTFEIGPPRVIEDATEERIVVRVPVTNTGARRGSEVVQLYVEPVAPRAFRPVKELKAFGKVWLEPGGSEVVELELDDRAFASWRPDPAAYAHACRRAAEHGVVLSAAVPPGEGPGGWWVEAGEYRLHVGRSSVEVEHVVTIERGGSRCGSST